MRAPFFIVCRKELREALRDRRTLFIMIFLPLITYPIAAVLGTEWLAAHEAARQARSSPVALVGAVDGASDLEQALRDPAAQLEVIRRPDLAPSMSGNPEQLTRAGVVLMVELPPEFATTLASGGAAMIRTYFDGANADSRLAKERVDAAIGRFAEAELARRVAANGLAPGFATPIPIEATNLASPAKLGLAEVARVLPFVLVLMVLMGAFYPAIDLTCGEKERGTLEALLSTPISREAIVAGKFLAVAAVSALTGILNLLCMATAAVWLMRSAAPVSVATLFRAVPWGTVGLGGLALVLAILFFSAVMMAVASLARTFKEGQNFLTPVVVLANFPAMAAWLPGTSLTWATAVVPVANVTLLLKDAVSGQLALGPSLVCLAATTVFAGLGLLAAARIFGSEPTLTAEGAGRSTKRLKAEVPAPAAAARDARSWTSQEALGLFGVCVVLVLTIGPDLLRWGPLGIAASEVLLIGLPVVAVTWARGGRFVETLALSLPTPRYLAAGALLGASAWCVILWLVVPLQQRLAPLPQEVAESLEQAAAPSGVPLWTVLVVTALVPAVFEELLCRGLLARALRRPLGNTGAILLSAALFGALHLSVYRFVPTFLLGIGFGFLTLASGSILPGIVAHAMNNAALVLLASPGGSTAARWMEENATATGLAATAVLAAAIALGASPGRTPQQSRR